MHVGFCDKRPIGRLRTLYVIKETQNSIAYFQMWLLLAEVLAEM